MNQDHRHHKVVLYYWNIPELPWIMNIIGRHWKKLYLNKRAHFFQEHSGPKSLVLTRTYTFDDVGFARVRACLLLAQIPYRYTQVPGTTAKNIIIYKHDMEHFWTYNQLTGEDL